MSNAQYPNATQCRWISKGKCRAPNPNMDRKCLYSAMIVPTSATAKAPQAPMPLRFAAPLDPEVPVAAAPLPWNVVPVTTWPLIVVVMVETPEVGTVVAAMVVLQSVHVPVNEVQGAP
jgi:hypothetical protein